MVDIDLNALQNQLAAIGVSGAGVTKAFQDAKQAAENFAGVSFSGVADTLKGYTQILKNVIGNAQDLKTRTDANALAFDSLAKSLSTVIALTTKFDAFKGLQVQGGHTIRTMGTEFGDLITRFGGWEQASQRLAGAGLSNIVKMGERGAAAFLDAASSAQNLENNYINLQAATGQLGKLFDNNGRLVTDLSGRVALYSVQLNNTASYTNKSLKEVADFSSKLGTIPNVLNSLIQTGKGVDDTLDGLTAAFTLARGAGQDVNEVYSAMKIAYENLGNAQGKVTDNSKKGAEMFALMSEANQKLGLRFEDTQGFLTHVATQFKNIGDNTQGATNILARFTGALQNTGLTAKASVELVQNMVDSIKNLEIGTKALISARTGGPGGLQGAFQVENLLRQGKTDEVAKMLEKSLRQQFGGRIYTQEEAGRSPQAAAQFMRQRTLLQSGAFGGLAKDADTATRLLEALKQGPVATQEAIKDGMGAVKDVSSKGNELQQTQVDVLKQVESALDRSVTLQEQQFLATARAAIGTGGNTPQATAWAEALKNFRESAANDTREQFSYSNKTRPEYLSLDSQQTKQNRAAGSDLISSLDVIPQIMDVGKDMIKDSVKAVGQSVQLAKDRASKESTMQEVQAQQVRSRAAESRGRADMRLPVQQAMRQTPATLAAAIPRAQEVMKHKVDVAPLEVNITVESPEGLKVQATTNRPATTTVKTVASTVGRGGITETGY